MFLIQDMLNNHRFCIASETGAWGLCGYTVRNIIPIINNAKKKITKGRLDIVVFLVDFLFWSSNNFYLIGTHSKPDLCGQLNLLKISTQLHKIMLKNTEFVPTFDIIWNPLEFAESICVIAKRICLCYWYCWWGPGSWWWRFGSSWGSFWSSSRFQLHTVWHWLHTALALPILASSLTFVSVLPCWSKGLPFSMTGSLLMDFILRILVLSLVTLRSIWDEIVVTTSVLSCTCCLLWKRSTRSPAKSRSLSWIHKVHWIPFLHSLVDSFIILINSKKK